MSTSSTPPPDAALLLLTCKAYLDLDTQVAINSMPPSEAATLKARYAELFLVKLSLSDGEREVVTRRAALARLLTEKSESLEMAMNEKTYLMGQLTAIEVERDELIAEMNTVEARDIFLQNELSELVSSAAAATANLETAEADNAQFTQPVMRELIQEEAAFASEAAAATAATAASNAATRALEVRADNIARSVARTIAARDASEVEINRAQSEPAKAIAALSGIERILQQVTEESERATKALTQRNDDATKQIEAAATARVLRAEVDIKLTKNRSDISAAQSRVDILEAALRSERVLTADLLGRKTELFAARDQVRSDLSAGSSAATSATNAYERAKRSLKQQNDSLNAARASIGPAEARLLTNQIEYAAAQRAKATADATTAAVRNEMDLLIAQFLKEEAIEKKFRDSVREAAEQCAEAEEERDARLLEDAAEEKVR
jgi:hypothetical protein